MNESVRCPHGRPVLFRSEPKTRSHRREWSVIRSVQLTSRWQTQARIEDQDRAWTHELVNVARASTSRMAPARSGLLRVSLLPSLTFPLLVNNWSARCFAHLLRP